MRVKVLVNGIGIVFITLSMIVGISIAYATVTSRLDINGYATMNSGSWDVHFENLHKVNLIGEASETVTPKLRDKLTSISNFDLNFYQPGDGAIYTFDVVNDGGLDAYISSITIPKPICSSNVINDYSNSKLVCDNLVYNLSYGDGSSVNIDDTLLSGTTKTLKLTLKYSGKSLPSNPVEISGLGITIIYSQK